MADRLRDGLGWLAGKLQQHAAQAVVYSRGDASVTVNATVGRTLLRLSDQYGGVRMEWTDRDYLIRASDLVIDGSTITPDLDDQIRETHDGVTQVYKVMEIPGEPAWRWSDPHQQILRIHVKRVGTE